MIYLPEPWPEELLSSVLVRCAKQFGKKVNPRKMTFALFGEYRICHPQYPRYVRDFADNLGMGIGELISGHTMYPLTAPFIEPELRRRLLDWMCGKTADRRPMQGRMLSGAMLETYRFCPKCWAEQNLALRSSMGWLRGWQVPQNGICPKHGSPLMDTGEPFKNSIGAIRLLDWSDIDLTRARPVETGPNERLMTETSKALFARPLQHLPSTEQWTRFWDRRLAGMTNKDLQANGIAYWGEAWLDARALKIDRTLLKGPGRRIWWKNLLLLKATEPAADLLAAVDEAASI